MSAEPAQPVFFYDLGSPECYLVAEQVMGTLPIVPEWEPVMARRLEVARATDRELIARLAGELGLQPIRWPAVLPVDGAQATLAATYAKRVGRAVAFSLAAFRQAFAGGRDLGSQDTVLIAAAACEMHPTALLKGMSLRSVRDAMTAAHDRAIAAGVQELPAIEADGRVFTGLDAATHAAAALGAPA